MTTIQNNLTNQPTKLVTKHTKETQAFLQEIKQDLALLQQAFSAAQDEARRLVFLKKKSQQATQKAVKSQTLSACQKAAIQAERLNFNLASHTHNAFGEMTGCFLTQCCVPTFSIIQ